MRRRRGAGGRRSARLGRVQARARRGASAPRSAKGARFMSETKTVSVGQIGRSLPRVEARSKVTGRAEYIHNLLLPGMLHAKIARSTIPHGRIRAIDTSAAKAMPGVHSVITGEDILKVIPDPYFGPAFHDQPILALGKVRFAGEPVAVVLAEDPKIAEAAAQEISIDYEELPAVLDEVEALIATTFVHEALKPAGMFADLKHLAGKRDTNVALYYHLRRGDVDKAFASADHLFEHVFRTPQQMHTPLEPHCAIAAALRDRRRDPGRRHGAQLDTDPVFGAGRDREAFGPAGEPGARARRFPGRRVRRQGLRKDGGACGRAVAASAPPGQGRADDGGAVLHDLEARLNLPHQERGDQKRADHRALLRGYL